MFTFVWDNFLDLMQRGGPVMWPLLALSVLAVMLSFERAWFYVTLNSGSRLARVRQMSAALRQKDHATARTLAKADQSVYGRVVLAIVDEQGGNVQAAAAEAIDHERRMLERFMTTLSTIITAAPMLGILGTVLGIISSFEILGGDPSATDPSQVSLGIAEALITTATGLIIALIALFPYNAFRAQLDATFSRLELLVTPVTSPEQPVTTPVPTAASEKETTA